MLKETERLTKILENQWSVISGEIMLGKAGQPDGLMSEL